jgi:hypothetical protein
LIENRLWATIFSPEGGQIICHFSVAQNDAKHPRPIVCEGSQIIHFFSMAFTKCLSNDTQ